jgi:hypothetical protein
MPLLLAFISRNVSDDATKRRTTPPMRRRMMKLSTMVSGQSSSV